ncbi:hypothetical protein RGI145_19630 [Roseomonas gilardii]|uniref:Chitinase n=1 Tax=Roseomonas gilardii TaxID=257708 RepID=A0A1L7ALF8_9PROT|nr:glycoside hydrolase family 19 protein [Roseomonas gilardii]APT59559.1 hypothetical protein RGI145_19630 [Roseomonas gilardii]
MSETTARTRVTAKLLRAVGAPAAAATLYAPILDAACLVPGDPVASITSRTGVAMLVAQLAHESGGFTQMTENLNYRVEALLDNRRFTAAQARALGRNDATGQKADQPAIAEIMYGGRMGNGPPGSGDGWRFRGGGPLQLTGRSNYVAWGKTLDLTAEQTADLVRTPEGGIAAALWFWRANGCLGPAYRGDVSSVTRIVNGGYNGLADRLARYQAAIAAV